MTIPDLQAIATSAVAPVRVEPNGRRVRVFFGGEVVADSTDTQYLFETDHLPVYYFPIGDVRAEYLVASSHTSYCPRKGDASYWDLVVADRRSEQAVWGYPHPIAEAPDISGYVAFWWDRVDAWFEEDDEVFVHARDPYKRVDVLQSSRHVQIVIDDVIVADTIRPRLLFETGLPIRYYVPRLDVRTDLLVASSTTTRCPYKGVAEYVSVQLADRLVADIAWVYPAPIPEIPKIENHLSFFNEHVDLIVDGVLQARPASPWS